MKKRTIVFGSVFTCFILLMIPNISATQYNQMKEVIEYKFQVNDYNFRNLVESKSQFDNNDTDFIDEILINIIENILNNYFKKIERLENFFDKYDDDIPIILIPFYLYYGSLMLIMYYGLPYAILKEIDDFIEDTEKYPDFIEFLITFISIPYFVLKTHLYVNYSWIIIFILLIKLTIDPIYPLHNPLF